MNTQKTKALKTFTFNDISLFEKRYRAQMINCISGIKSMNLIGTQGQDGQKNLAIFSSVIHMGSNPPLIGFIQRPTTVDRHTYENIISTSYYTINAVTEDLSMKAHQTSARYEKNENEFEETSIEHEYLNGFLAPFVKNTPMKIGLKLEDIIPIEANNTKLIIGKVEQLHINEDYIEEDGRIRIEDTTIVGGAGLDTYLRTEKHGRYSYAKPDETLKNL